MMNVFLSELLVWYDARCRQPRRIRLCGEGKGLRQSVTTELRVDFKSLAAHDFAVYFLNNRVQDKSLMR